MNTPEKIVQTYLRLNGFFTIPHFSVLQDDGTHVDFLALRVGGSIEKVGKNEDAIALSLDSGFLKQLGVSEKDTVGLVVEVKGGNEEAVVSNAVFEYVKPFFGTVPKLCKVGFKERQREIGRQRDQVTVPLNRCLKFIFDRFFELERIEEDLRGSGRLTKQGSWYLSEEFLSDLLFLKKTRLELGRQSGPS